MVTPQSNMSSYSLSNILLPAVFISSAVFSTLTVPFALIGKEPVIIELPPFYSGEIQPIFDGNHKEVAIPYIGFSIVVSVGAGMATVEMIRRWNQWSESTTEAEESSTSPQNSLESPIQPEALDDPEYRPEVSAIDLPPLDEGMESPWLTHPEGIGEKPEIPIETDSLLVELPQTLPTSTERLSVTLEEPDLSRVAEGNNVIQFVPRHGNQSATLSLDVIESEILESRDQYKTCRIQIPHLKRRLFAIAVEGQYYSFLRTEKTKEKVLEVLTRLGDSVQKTVITKTEKGYVIWAWEPEIA